VSPLCPEVQLSVGDVRVNGAKLWWTLGEAVPKTLEELQAIVAAKPLPAGCKASPSWVSEAGFAALDLSKGAARPLGDYGHGDDGESAATLVAFLRQLDAPRLGVFLVDHRGISQLLQTFSDHQRLVPNAENPVFTTPVTIAVCWGRTIGSSESPRLSFAPCHPPTDQWTLEGSILAWRERRDGAEAFCIAKKPGTEVYKVKKGENCDEKSMWGGGMSHVASFYLPGSSSDSESLIPQEPQEQVCVTETSGHSDLKILTVGSSSQSACPGLSLTPLSLRNWDDTWNNEKGAVMLQRNPSGCHLFICNRHFLRQQGGRFVDNVESGNR